MSPARTEIPCPSCQKLTVWSVENPFRPFCSQRCKLIDFGGWANETHAIPGAAFIAEQDDANEDESI